MEVGGEQSSKRQPGLWGTIQIKSVCVLCTCNLPFSPSLMLLLCTFSLFSIDYWSVVLFVSVAVVCCAAAGQSCRP